MAVQAPVRARRPLRIGIGTLVALAVAGGLGVWVWRTVRESVAIARLADSIRTGSILERQTAARGLGRTGPDAVQVAIPALVQALQDSDQGVREEAAQALGKSYRAAEAAGPEGHSQARAASLAVLGNLKDERPGVRAASALAFGVAASAGSSRVLESEGLLFDPDIVLSALSNALGDDNEQVRREAARAIGAIGRRVVAEPPLPLIRALQNDPSVDVRVAAARALAGFPTSHSAVLTALLSGFSDANPTVVRACAASIDTSRPAPELISALIRALCRPERNARGAAAAVLARIGPEAGKAVPALIGLLKEPVASRNPPTRPFSRDADPAFMAAMALGRIAPGSGRAAEVVTPLADLLRSEDSWRRLAAASTLGLIGPAAASATPGLIEALRDSIAYHETAIYGTDVAIALGRIAPGSPMADEAVIVLTEALDERWEPTRANAAAALGRFGAVARPALPRLRALLNDPFPSVNQNAAAALRAIVP